MDVPTAVCRHWSAREATSAEPDTKHDQRTACSATPGSGAAAGACPTAQLRTPLALNTHGYRVLLLLARQPGAVEAVIADIDQLGLAPSFCLGDLGWLWPPTHEVVELVRERGIPAARAAGMRTSSRGSMPGVQLSLHNCRTRGQAGTPIGQASQLKAETETFCKAFFFLRRGRLMFVLSGSPTVSTNIFRLHECFHALDERFLTSRTPCSVATPSPLCAQEPWLHPGAVSGTCMGRRNPQVSNLAGAQQLSSDLPLRRLHPMRGFGRRPPAPPRAPQARIYPSLHSDPSESQYYATLRNYLLYNIVCDDRRTSYTDSAFNRSVWEHSCRLPITTRLHTRVT